MGHDVKTKARRRPGMVAESLILAIAGYTMLWLMATNEQMGGYLLALGRLGRTYRVLYVLALVLMALGAALAVCWAWRGRRSAGVWMMAGVVGLYALFLNGGSYPGVWCIPAHLVEINQSMTVLVDGCDSPGTELWLNGVMVGTLPLHTTVNELRAKVPYWSTPPADFGTDRQGVWHEGGESKVEMGRWAEMGISKPYTVGSPQKPADHDTYYARVRYGGEWGCFPGDSGRGSFGSGHVQIVYASMGVRFPNREQRLRELLNLARMNDYRMDERWAKALDSYGADGWISVRKAMKSEPGMRVLWDALARHKLGPVADAQEAWREFERICQEADQRRWYRTDDPTGRAVELLCERLPLDRLIAKASELVRQSSYVQYWASLDGTGQGPFGTFQQEAVNAVAGTEGRARSGGFGWGGKEGVLPPSGFVVAHALRHIACEAGPRGEACRDMIARHVVPELFGEQMAQSIPAGLAEAILEYGAAAEVVRDFERRYRESRDGGNWEDRLSGGDKANRWLFYLAATRSPDAELWRRENSAALLKLADDRLADAFGTDSRVEHVQFLYSEPKLALAFWPTFLAWLQHHDSPGFEKLAEPWTYLKRLGDQATAAMYVDAAAELRPQEVELRTAMPILRSLPVEKRQQIIKLLAERIAAGTFAVNQDFAREGDAKAFLTAVENGLKEDTDYARRPAEYRLGELTTHLTPENLASAREYLSQGRPDAMLVEMLAQRPEPELRELSLVGIRYYATPDRRRLLVKLSADEDAGVRQAAEKVMAELSELARMGAEAYSSLGRAVSTLPVQLER